jgi:hypothetical protein
MLGGPAVGDEFGREPVQQIRMRGARTLKTEIVRGGDEATAEVLLPDAVCGDPGQEVPGPAFWIGEPAGERGAAVAGSGTRQSAGEVPSRRRTWRKPGEAISFFCLGFPRSRRWTCG